MKRLNNWIPTELHMFYVFGALKKECLDHEWLMAMGKTPRYENFQTYHCRFSQVSSTAWSQNVQYLCKTLIEQWKMDFDQMKKKDQPTTKIRPITEEIILIQPDYTSYDYNNTKEKTKMIDVSKFHGFMPQGGGGCSVSVTSQKKDY